ncbi:MAG: tetratricopeptide repeat protein [Myxococcales bacterium]|nr:tetratricopeptide repeat protein [Myxococcales bacterium]MCB9647964.1 tetratricopeptide repeat protein [Deltaproteobacteria bacterium]
MLQRIGDELDVKQPQNIRLAQYLLVIASVTVLLLVSEAVLWSLGVPLVADQGDASFGFSSDRTVFVREGDVFRVRPEVRGTVFNDTRFEADKPVDGFRAFVLGGSSAYGFPWSDKQAFSGILDAALQRSRSGPVEVINVGGLSYAMHRLSILSQELVRYSPDVLIIYSGHNEFVERIHFANVNAESEVMRKVRRGLAHTRLYSFAVQLAHPEPAKASEFLTVQRSLTHRYTTEEKEEVAEDFRAGLAELIATAHAHKVPVVLCTVPANLADWQPNASLLATDDPKHWQQSFAAGKDALNRHAAEEARQMFEEARRLAPGHAETAYLLGQACEALEDYDCARRAYADAADLDASPERRLSEFNAAIVAAAGRGQTPSLSVLDVEATFTATAAHGLIGFDLIEDYVHPTLKGHRLIAKALYHHLAQLGVPTLERVMNDPELDRLAVEAQSAGQQRSAAWFFNQGVVLENAGHLDQALKAYANALDVAPDYFGAIGNTARILYERGDRAGAAKYIGMMAELNPRDVGGLVLQANVALDEKRFEDAMRLLQTAIEEDPTRTTPWMMLGSALRDQHRPEEAIEPLRRATALDPGHAEARLLYGVVLMETGRFDEAQREIEQAVRLDPSAARAHLYLGLVHENQNRLEEASQAYQEALRLRPGYQDAEQGRQRTGHQITGGSPSP